MASYRLSDDGSSETIKAENMEEAKIKAEENWQSGSWDGKSIISVRVAELDEDGDETGEVEWINVECGEDEPEPDCTSDDGHDWQSPYEVIGGSKENPGAWSKGGTTMVIKQCCANCGKYKRETSYGSQRGPGQCDKIEYIDADESSLAWIAGGVE